MTNVIVKNPRSATEAVAAAEGLIRAHTPGWAGLCDHTVAIFYGWSHSGAPTAYDHWLSIPATLKHNGPSHPPFGVLHFWGHGAGHVGMQSRTTGKMYASDSAEHDHIGLASLSQPHDVWGLPYLGWAFPYFPHATGGIRTANRIYPEPVGPRPKPVPIWYSVQGGETLATIARDHAVTVAQLLVWNASPYRSTPVRLSTPLYRGSRVIIGLH